MRKSDFGFRISDFGILPALRALVISLFILSPASRLHAQSEDQPPAPPTQRTEMRITFLPPPMECTLSLGIYDKKGKLVRVLTDWTLPQAYLHLLSPPSRLRPARVRALSDYLVDTLKPSCAGAHERLMALREP